MRQHPRRLDPNTIVLLKQIAVGMAVLSVAGLLITGVWYGTRISALTITQVEASGGETIAPSHVEERVEQVLDGTYLGLVPRRFAWFYPEQEIVEKVGQIERLYNVQLIQESSTKLRVTYDEYVPHALWCGEQEAEGCLFINKDGYAFGEAPKLTGGTFLRFITLGRETVIGETLAERNIYDNLQKVVELLAARQWYISQVEIDQVGDAFLEVVGGGELKVHAKESPEQTVENLFVILTSEDFSQIRPGNFQYVDLRFGNKVFVNEEPTIPHDATPEETASSSQLE